VKPLMRPGNEKGSKLPPGSEEKFSYQSDPEEANAFLSDYMVRNRIPPEIAFNPTVAAQVAAGQDQLGS